MAGAVNFARYRSLLRDAAGNGTSPQQIHTNFGADPQSTFVFTWNTQQSVAAPMVRFGSSPSSLTSTVAATVAAFDQPAQFINTARLSNLTAGTTYFYQVGSPDGGWSDTLPFQTAAAPGTAAQGNFTWAVYGDMGLENEQSMPLLIADVDAGRIDGVLHIGDLAYDLDSDSGSRGDAFMASIQPVASRVPYHACPGTSQQARTLQLTRMVSNPSPVTRVMVQVTTSLQMTSSSSEPGSKCQAPRTPSTTASTWATRTSSCSPRRRTFTSPSTAC